MALDSYTTLKASIADWLNRSDLTSQIPDFIALCEARLRRTVETKSLSVLEATLSAGEQELSMPDAIVVRSVSIADSNLGATVMNVTHAALMEYRREFPSTSVPKWYAVVGELLEFAPATSADVLVSVEVEGPLTPLSSTVATNWILDSYPDVYLYGALAEAAPFLRDDERIPVWNGRYEAAIRELKVNQDRWRFPGGINVPVPRTFADCPPR